MGCVGRSGLRCDIHAQRLHAKRRRNQRNIACTLRLHTPEHYPISAATSHTLSHHTTCPSTIAPSPSAPPALPHHPPTQPHAPSPLIGCSGRSLLRCVIRAPRLHVKRRRARRPSPREVCTTAAPTQPSMCASIPYPEHYPPRQDHPVPCFRTADGAARANRTLPYRTSA